MGHAAGGSGWRVAAWGGAAGMLLLLLLAMQVSKEVQWDAADFVLLGTMLAAAGGGYELAARMSGNWAYRAGAGLALAAAFTLVWINLAVGVIGSEDNPANLVYGGVLGVALVGALAARFRAEGMARAMAATALAQMVAAPIAIAAGLGPLPAGAALELAALNGCFAAIWLGSGWLFRKAARERGSAPAQGSSSPRT
ncbi:MAG TPA: hypothetical protein VF589_01295 [Allosphingosinicella sp.]